MTKLAFIDVVRQIMRKEAVITAEKKQQKELQKKETSQAQQSQINSNGTSEAVNPTAAKEKPVANTRLQQSTNDHIKDSSGSKCCVIM